MLERVKLRMMQKRYKPVVDVESEDFSPIPTSYKVLEKDEFNQKVKLVPTPAVLVSKY